MKRINGFEVYYQERDCKFDSKKFKDRKTAIIYLIDQIIYHGGVELESR